MAAVMAFIASLSPAFRGCYLLDGFSNTADGALARHCLTQTKQAARLDSGADFLFFYRQFRVFFVLPAGCRGVLRAFLYCCCAIFSLPGINTARLYPCIPMPTKPPVCFCFFPLFFCPGGTAGLFLCAVAFFASLEETLLLLCQSRLDVNCKSIFLFPVDSFPFSYFFVLNAFLSFSLVFLQNNEGLFGLVFFLCFAACFIQYKNPRCKKRGLCASK